MVIRHFSKCAVLRCILTDFEKEEDKDQDTINLSKKSKSAIESNKLIDVKLDLPRDSLHGVIRVAKEHYLNAGAAKSETLDVSCNFTSPLHQQSILQHNLNQKSKLSLKLFIYIERSLCFYTGKIMHQVFPL